MSRLFSAASYNFSRCREISAFNSELIFYQEIEISAQPPA